MVGFGPTTYSLRKSYSTPELHRHLEAILSKLRLKCDVINISLGDQLEHVHSK